MSNLVNRVFGNLKVTEVSVDTPKHKQYICHCVACGAITLKWDSVLLDKRIKVSCPTCGEKRKTPEYWHFQAEDKLYTVRAHSFEDATRDLPPGSYRTWCTIPNTNYAQRLHHKDI